jgi:hypothetical protein
VHNSPLVGHDSPLVGLPIPHNKAHIHALCTQHQFNFDVLSAQTQSYFDTPCTLSSLQMRNHHCHCRLTVTGGCIEVNLSKEISKIKN